MCVCKKERGILQQTGWGESTLLLQLFLVVQAQAKKKECRNQNSKQKPDLILTPSTDLFCHFKSENYQALPPPPWRSVKSVCISVASNLTLMKVMRSCPVFLLMTVIPCELTSRKQIKPTASSGGRKRNYNNKLSDHI